MCGRGCSDALVSAHVSPVAVLCSTWRLNHPCVHALLITVGLRCIQVDNKIYFVTGASLHTSDFGPLAIPTLE